MTFRRLFTAIRQMFCRHDWIMSRYVNIATGENLGSICTKCWKVQHQTNPERPER